MLKFIFTLTLLSVLGTGIAKGQSSRMNLQFNDVPTTQKLAFSSSFTTLNYDGFDLVKKQSDKIRVLIIGSSNAQGAGASNYAKSWVSKLESYLQTKGVITRNVSIGGTSTSTTLSRLYQDVLTWNPTVVIEATALWNEGLYGGNYLATNTAIDNLAKIESLCKQQGIHFLKGPVLPANSETDVVKKYSLSLQYANTLDAYILGDANVITTDKLIDPSVSVGDGVHVNDLGHLHIYQSINPYLITHHFLDNRLPSTIYQGEGCCMSDTSVNKSVNAGFDLTIPTDQILSSFSLAFQVKSTNTSSLKTLVSLSSTNAWGLQIAANGTIEMVKSTMAPLSSGVTLSNAEYSDVIFTYNALKGTCDLWINGVKKVSYAGEAVSSIPKIRLLNSLLLGNSPGLGLCLKNVFLYKTALRDNVCKDLFKTIFPKRSLLLYAPCNDELFLGGRLLNLACSPWYLEQNAFCTR